MLWETSQAKVNEPLEAKHAVNKGELVERPMDSCWSCGSTAKCLRPLLASKTELEEKYAFGHAAMVLGEKEEK